jgi:hypothetical protein
MVRMRILAAPLLGGLVLAGCATPPQPGENVVSYNFAQAFNNPDACSHNAGYVGTFVGFGVGFGFGMMTHHSVVQSIGLAAAGAAGGALIGTVIDQRRCNAYHVAQQYQLQVAAADLTAGQIGEAQGGNKTVGSNMLIQNDGQFAQGSAALTPNARAGVARVALDYAPQQIANVQSGDAGQNLAAAQQRTVLVISRASGDADAGDDPAALTAQRAQSVAQVMANSGVPARNIYVQGAGDSDSVVPSADPAAKAANNSTQILDFPDKQAMQDYLAQNAVTPPAGAVAAGAAPPVAVASAQHWPGYDFGGAAVSGAPQTVALGAADATPGLALISSSFAGAPMNIEACTLDHPRKAAPVTNFATGEALPASGAIPGFYGAPWEGGFNGNLVDALNAYVPVDAGANIPDPTFEVYRNYHNGNARPDYRRVIPVNVYRSQDKILYRMFPGGPVQCLDLVVANDTPEGQGRLYYPHDGRLFAANGALALRH